MKPGAWNSCSVPTVCTVWSVNRKNVSVQTMRFCTGMKEYWAVVFFFLNKTKTFNYNQSNELLCTIVVNSEVDLFYDFGWFSSLLCYIILNQWLVVLYIFTNIYTANCLFFSLKISHSIFRYFYFTFFGKVLSHKKLRSSTKWG